jgi:hypothetical protein
MSTKPKELTLEDVGTRYQHLNDHYEFLEAVISDLLARPNAGPQEKQVAIKLRNAADIVKSTIDSYAGLNDSKAEFGLYRLINGIPKDPNTVEGGRGTPLC